MPNSALDNNCVKPTDGEIDVADTSKKPNLNPQQFAISELFWVLVFVAVILAIAMPFLRMLPADFLNSIVTVVSFQSLAILLMVGFVSRRRKRMLERSGRLIGVGSSSESQSRNWAVFIAFLVVVLSVVMQLYLTFALSSAISTKGGPNTYFKALNAIMSVSSSFFFTFFFLMNSIRFLRWRIHPSTVEFFENGVAWLDTLSSWDKVELRRSTFYPNRIMVVYRHQQTSGMVWMEETRINSLLAFAAVKKSAKVELKSS